MGRPNPRLIGAAVLLVVVLVVVAIGVVARPAGAAPRGGGVARVHRDRHVPGRGHLARVGARRRVARRSASSSTRARRSRRRPTARSPRRSPKSGYLVAVIPMPLNLAILGVSKADGPIGAHPEITALGDRRALARRLDGRAVRGGPPRRGSPGSRSGRPTRRPTCRPRDLAVLSTWGSLDARRRPDVRGRGPRRRPGRMPCSPRSRAATTSRWAGTRGSRTTRRRAISREDQQRERRGVDGRAPARAGRGALTRPTARATPSPGATARTRSPAPSRRSRARPRRPGRATEARPAAPCPGASS